VKEAKAYFAGANEEGDMLKILWSDSAAPNQSATGAFSLYAIFEKKEAQPTSCTAFEHSTCKTFNVPLFDDEDSEVSNQFERL
jgi:hypothetical protein